ncbi:MAG: hypothetical protein H7Y60_17985 [Rhodospirillaceae bacterium]|nr:hypothetical protein [Rhodospirillales bacterium]
MAMFWIKEIRNYHPTGTISLRCDDGGRLPKLDGKIYGRDEWLQLPAPKTGEMYSSIRPENLAVPWSYGFSQKMVLKSDVKGSPTTTLEIRGEGGWDYLVVRDDETREIGQVEVGTLGDAPGVNHSWWVLALHSDGDLKFHCTERQGLTRDEALAFGTFFINFALDAIGMTAKAVGVVAGDGE